MRGLNFVLLEQGVCFCLRVGRFGGVLGVVRVRSIDACVHYYAYSWVASGVWLACVVGVLLACNAW